MLEHALRASSLGPIFPVHTTISGKCSCGRDCGKNAGKHPRVRNWPALATQDPETIRSWWRKWPDANVGLATGHGLVVVDLDSREHLERLRELCKAHGGLPRTLTARTGRGLHLYFTGDVGSSHVRDGILFRGLNGFVVVPPSLHASGRRYEWLNGGNDGTLAIAPLPDWLQTRAQVSENKGSTPIDWSVLGARPAYLNGGSDELANVAANALKPQWSAHEEARIRSALMTIPASIAYDAGWFEIGAALRHAEWVRPDGTDIGLELFCDWSATCPEKYSQHDCETKWRGWGREAGPKKGIGYIFWLAHQYGWTGGGTAAGGGADSFARGESGTKQSDEKVNGEHALPPQLTAPDAQAQAIRFPDVNKAGHPISTCANTAVALRKLDIECAYDRFHDKFRIGGQVIAEWAGDVADPVAQMVRVLVKSKYGFDPGLQHAFDASMQLALQHSYDPVVDYLDELEWDRAPRLGRWLTTYMQAEDCPLNRAMGTLALIAAVRRARHPGTKFDQIIVLEGPENKGKSLAIETLAGTENYTDQPILALSAREQMEAMQGVWLYEIAELSGMRRAEVEHIKSFASRTWDRARPAYGRARIDRPRRTVFFATTNDDRYLKSQTGNRRFWPVRTGDIDIAGLRRDRDQLWAEAAHHEQSGVSLVLPPQLWGAALQQQENRRITDPWEDMLIGIEQSMKETHPSTTFLGANEWRISTRDLFEKHLRLATEYMNDVTAKRLSTVMRLLGWEGPKPLRNGKDVMKGYIKRVQQQQQ